MNEKVYKDSVFVLSCYCDTDEKIKYLYDLINNLKRFNIPIAIATHYQLPEFIYKLTDYFIYDKNNILADIWSMSYWYDNGRFIVEYENPYKTPYHGAAVYSSIKNVADFFVNKFSVIHFMEGDSNGDFDQYLKHVDMLLDNDHDIVAFPFCTVPNKEIDLNVTGMLTNLFSFNTSFINKKLPNIRRWEDYKIIAKPHLVLEDVIYQYLSRIHEQQRICFLPSKSLDQVFKIENKTSVSKNIHFFMADAEPDSVVLFIINASDNGDNVNYTINNNGTISNYIVKAKHGHFFVYSKDPKVIICNGDGVTSRFVINKAVSFPQNTFKFYDGSIVCPHKK